LRFFKLVIPWGTLFRQLKSCVFRSDCANIFEQP
jgi:hypothetical protein